MDDSPKIVGRSEPISALRALLTRIAQLAKRLIDYGFHPYTVSFPLIVHGAMMIEPTETESKQNMDRFIEVMRTIADEARRETAQPAEVRHRTRQQRAEQRAHECPAKRADDVVLKILRADLHREGRLRHDARDEAGQGPEQQHAGRTPGPQFASLMPLTGGEQRERKDA